MAIQNLQSIITEIPLLFQSLTVGTARLLMILTLLPLLGGGTLKGLLRSSVAIALSIPAAVVVYEQLHGSPVTPTIWIMLIVKEALVGFLVGLVLSFPFWALESVGAMIDNQRGAATAMQINPMSGVDGTVLSPVLSQAFATTLLVSGAFTGMVALIYSTFKVWHPLEMGFPVGPGSSETLLLLFRTYTELFARLAAPAVIVMLMLEGGLALLSVYAPSLQVFFLAMPVKSVGAIAFLAVTLSIMWDFSYQTLGSYDDWLGSITRLLGR